MSEPLSAANLAAIATAASSLEAASSSAAHAMKLWNAKAQRDAMVMAESLHRAALEALRRTDLEAMQRASQYVAAGVETRHREYLIAIAAHTMRQIAEEEKQRTALAAAHALANRATPPPARKPSPPCTEPAPTDTAPDQSASANGMHQAEIATLKQIIADHETCIRKKDQIIAALRAELEQQLARVTRSSSLVRIDGQSGENSFGNVANTIIITHNNNYYYGTNENTHSDGESS